MTRREAAAWLCASLPESDGHDMELIMEFAAHALMLRRDVPWCHELPEELFLSYVLCPRVNDEPLLPHRREFYDELWPRVKGIPLKRAVLEANFWCLEKATYRSTDDRTAPPVTVIARAFGRCGEESTLLTCALRSIGVAARQIYVPRWSHCDDCHAWVEAYVDGAWRYLGACEPENELDRGWFTGPASRAMLAHTRAFGCAPSGEEIIGADGNCFIVNRTRAYAKATRLNIRVTENGAPLPGARVRLEVFNMGEMYPINAQITDGRGEVAIDVGLGGLRLCAAHGGRHMSADIDTRDISDIELKFENAGGFEPGESEFGMEPPKPGVFTDAERDPATLMRIAACNSVRAAYEATFAKGDELLERALGNHARIKEFLDTERYGEDDKRALLKTLRYKDMADISVETLVDALDAALPSKGAYPREIWLESVLAPRVENEWLSPCRGRIRAFIAASGARPETARDVWELIKANVSATRACDIVVSDSAVALEFGRTDARSRDILFVNACRALGLAARLCPVTRAKEYFSDGEYRAIEPCEEKTARVLITSLAPLRCAEHFTLGRYDNGTYRTLNLGGITTGGALELAVPPGRYRLLTGSRQIDGAVLAREARFEAIRGQTVEIEALLRPDDISRRLLDADIGDITLTDASGAHAPLSAACAGHKAILAFLAPASEPTEHLLDEMTSLCGELKSAGICFIPVVDDASEMKNEKLARALYALGEERAYTCATSGARQRLRVLMNVFDSRPPLSIAIDNSGRGRFAFANYNVGTARMLLDVLRAC